MAGLGHDVIIVGGGVQGVMMALECVGRGKIPLLIERDRIGCGASSNSFGVIHGGLRYLQSLDYPRWQVSRREQAWFAREFAPFVAPLRCTMPLYRGALRSPTAFRAAFMLERLALRISALESAAEPPGLIAPHGVQAIYPVVQRGLLAGACWSELVVGDMHALLVSALLRVTMAGGSVVEGCTAVDLRASRGVVTGLMVQSRHSGRYARHDAPTIILCTGADTEDLAMRLDRPLPHFSARTLAFNLLLDAPPPTAGAIAVSPTPGRGRSYFLRAAPGGVLAGTAYASAKRASRGWRAVPSPLVDEFQAKLARAAPALAGARVLKIFHGWLPDRDGIGRRMRVRDLAWHHGSHGGPRGLITLVATKLTTAHAQAARLADRLWPETRSAGAFTIAGDVGGNRLSLEDAW
jgi:glycerol-3-phosphate dehydrogenase